MIQKTLGDDTMSTAQIKVWHKCFKNGRESVESDPHSGKPARSRTPENVKLVRIAINKDRQQTMWELEADLGIPKTTVSKILTQDLGMKHVMAKFVPQLLLPKQKEYRAAVANNLMQTATNEPDFPKEVILEKNHQSMAISMIQKQRPIHPKGSRLVLHTWRRYGKVSARSRPC